MVIKKKSQRGRMGTGADKKNGVKFQITNKKKKKKKINFVINSSMEKLQNK